MEQKTANKEVTHDGIRGTISLTLFTEYTDLGVYMNRVQAWFGNGEDVQSVFDETVAQPVMDSTIKAAEAYIIKGINEWHIKFQQPIVDGLIVDGFGFTEEIMLAGVSNKVVETMIDPVIEEEQELKSQVEASSSVDIESTDDVNRDVISETVEDDW